MVVIEAQIPEGTFVTAGVHSAFNTEAFAFAAKNPTFHRFGCTSHDIDVAVVRRKVGASGQFASRASDRPLRRAVRRTCLSASEVQGRVSRGVGTVDHRRVLICRARVYPGRQVGLERGSLSQVASV